MRNFLFSPSLCLTKRPNWEKLIFFFKISDLFLCFWSWCPIVWAVQGGNGMRRVCVVAVSDPPNLLKSEAKWEKTSEPSPSPKFKRAVDFLRAVLLQQSGVFVRPDRVSVLLHLRGRKRKKREEKREICQRKKPKSHRPKILQSFCHKNKFPKKQANFSSRDEGHR